MMFRYTDDPVADAEAYYNYLAQLEEKLPVCRHCNRPVMEDFYYEITEERPICAKCLEKCQKMKIGFRHFECEHHGGTIHFDDDYCYINDDGLTFCKACVNKHYKKRVVVD